jgi:beta-galactosidase
MNIEKFSKLFPLGTHLCREPMPSMAEMKRDMDLMKNNGFNLIKLQENWMLDEPEEGKYDFSKYAELIEHAAKLDLGIYLGLTCEQAPNWLWRKHPDARMVGRDGLPAAYQAQSTLPADGKPGPCYDHPGAMADQLRFIKRLVADLGKFENIVVWNTWQEIGYWSEGFIGSHVCYCDNTINAYRKWLSGLYNGDIAKLNNHWNVKYCSFEDIIPERSKRKGDTPQEFYFHYYMDNVNVSNVLSARYEAIKQADPLGRPIFAHKGGPALSSGMDWTYARTQDFLGTSNYPAWSNGSIWDDHRQGKRLEMHDALYTEMWDSLAYRMDHIRSANRPGAPIWAAEYQGGPISTDFHLGRRPMADDMRRWMLTTLGAGATAISFWVTRAEIMAPETNGFALLDSEGDTTERLEEVAVIGKALNKHAALFAQNNRLQADVAILLDEWKYQQLSALSFASEALAYDVRGWYRLLWDNNIACDFIEASQLAEDRTQKYKAVIVPLPLSMSDDLAEKLAEYAKAGGNVVLEAAPGRLNEVAFALRGEMNPILRKILKVSQKRFTLMREPAETDRWSQPERTWGEYADACFLDGEGALAGFRLRANMYLQTFVADDNDVVLHLNGEPAGVCRAYGSGKIWLLGTYIGPSGTAYREDDTPAAVRKLLEVCGVLPSHDGKLLLRKRINSDSEAWFITNPNREVMEESFMLPESTKVYDLLGENVVNKDGAAIVRVEPLDVRVLVVCR